MEHTSVDFLLLNDLRLFEILHGLDELLDSGINFRIFGRKDFLEMLICSCIDFFRVLAWLIVLWEELLVAGDKLLDPIERLFLDLFILA